MHYLALLFLLLSSSAAAGDWHLLSLDEFSMDQYQIVNHRDHAYPFADAGGQGEVWTKGTKANFNLDLIKYKSVGLYADNSVIGNSTDRQFREVAWDWEAGVRVANWAKFYWHHTSAHILDYTPTGPFRLDNYYGVQFVFYKRGR